MSALQNEHYLSMLVRDCKISFEESWLIPLLVSIAVPESLLVDGNVLPNMSRLWPICVEMDLCLGTLRTIPYAEYSQPICTSHYTLMCNVFVYEEELRIPSTSKSTNVKEDNLGTIAGTSD